MFKSDQTGGTTTTARIQFNSKDTTCTNARVLVTLIPHNKLNKREPPLKGIFDRAINQYILLESHYIR